MLESAITQAARDYEAHVERLQNYIRQPSVSAENRGHADMAALIVKDIEALGGVGEIVPGVDFPIVYGRFDVGAPRTMVMHSMYDTTPADEPTWVVPPFEARRISNYENLGECIVGRGAEDTKGPLATIVSAVHAYHAANVPLPCNVIMIFEASELGSKSLPPFVAKRADELKHADVCFWPWYTQKSDGTQVVFLRVKGLMTLKLRCRGGEWGGPQNAEIHGAHSTWIANPAHRLAAALASMKSEGDLDVAIDGFYDGRNPPTPEDEQLVEKLAKRFNAERALIDLGVTRFKQQSIKEAIRARCFQSEFNVAGLKSGYVAEGAHKVIVPHEAVAALDMRPLDGMSTDNMLESMRRHLDKHGFTDVTIEPLSQGYAGGGSPPGDWAVRELLETYGDCDIDPEVWPRDSLAIAAKLFTDLGMSWIATVPGHANRRHSANEYIQLKGYRRSIEFTVRLMWRIAHAQKS
ncbi:MAG TPA: M20/M25/M40 family metallo-hydrolase [Chthoniobacterales bacterium]|nr:M20/M25/M40 family metallo-hydrolase [Chthoniobacterales bacterium]